MIVPDPNMFGGDVLVYKKQSKNWSSYKTNNMPLGKINIRAQSSRANESPTNANYRGVGLSEMIYAIQNNKIHKCNGDLSLHILHVINSIHQSARTKKKIKIKFVCKKPVLFSKKIIKLIKKN